MKHGVFNKSIKVYLILAWFLKEKQKHKGHKSCEQNKNRGIPIIVERKMGCQPGHPQA